MKGIFVITAFDQQRQFEVLYRSSGLTTKTINLCFKEV